MKPPSSPNDGTAPRATRTAEAGLDPLLLAAVECAPVDPEVSAEITRALDKCD